jgi:hypothetical protein
MPLCPPPELDAVEAGAVDGSPRLLTIGGRVRAGMTLEMVNVGSTMDGSGMGDTSCS